MKSKKGLALGKLLANDFYSLKPQGDQSIEDKVTETVSLMVDFPLICIS